MPKRNADDTDKPNYVVLLEKAYGPPSEEGFGSAVFFDRDDRGATLEELAKKYYQRFVGNSWERWGQDAWLAAWKEVYARRPSTGHDIVAELNGIEDDSVSSCVPMILTAIDNADQAAKALEAAFNVPQVVALRVYRIGDGEAMTGLLLAGRREHGDTTVLVFLMD